MLKVSKAAEKLGVSVITLQRWDRDGILKAHRSSTNRRYYTEDQIYQFKVGNKENIPKLNIAYCRVSNRTRKNDLNNQKEFIRNYVNGKGVILDDFYEDIGSGLNYKREKFNKLLDLIMECKIDTIYITYKDRFVRFGFDWFERLCNKFGTQIVVLNNEKTSPEKELIDDLISIIHVFSCRIYGLRKYKKMIKEDKDVTFL